MRRYNPKKTQLARRKHRPYSTIAHGSPHLNPSRIAASQSLGEELRHRGLRGPAKYSATYEDTLEFNRGVSNG